MASYSAGQFTNRRPGGDPNSYGVSSPPGTQPTQLFEDTSGMPSVPPIHMAQQLINNPVVAGAAMEYGQGIMSAGQQYLDKEVSGRLEGLKVYFAVDTSYVIKKLFILLLPYHHRDWALRYDGSQPVQPRQDVNAPDLYIPIMGFVTYILLTGLVLGTQNRFTPEQLGLSASSLLVWLLIEVLLIYFGLFIARVTVQFSWMELLAYCTYKYTSMIVCITASLLSGHYGYYIALLWTAVSIAYFEVQSLRLRVQPTVSAGGGQMRNYLILLIAILQPLMVLWLTWSLVMYTAPLTL